ncbi:hypothetical protein F2P81_011258 [Scophthalmus maximus]|uniref:Uncharacterized protein n=1 Tax=Scophthalmus maximus TaxID=52904 RepID=A0A6A4SL54_SCOMX|nr:hypothetical protein F2P81_011258 [Scophthalmus maximus]
MARLSFSPSRIGSKNRNHFTSALDELLTLTCRRGFHREQTPKPIVRLFAPSVDTSLRAALARYPMSHTSRVQRRRDSDNSSDRAEKHSGGSGVREPSTSAFGSEKCVAPPQAGRRSIYDSSKLKYYGRFTSSVLLTEEFKSQLGCY